MAKIRKALVAAFWGGASAAAGGFAFTGAPTRDQVWALLSLFVAGALATGAATWKAKANVAG